MPLFASLLTGLKPLGRYEEYLSPSSASYHLWFSYPCLWPRHQGLALPFIVPLGGRLVNQCVTNETGFCWDGFRDWWDGSVPYHWKLALSYSSISRIPIGQTKASDFHRGSRDTWAERNRGLAWEPATVAKHGRTTQPRRSPLGVSDSVRGNPWLATVKESRGFRCHPHSLPQKPWAEPPALGTGSRLEASFYAPLFTELTEQTR